nr:peptidoglycan-binding protein [Thauera sp. K11]
MLLRKNFRALRRVALSAFGAAVMQGAALAQPEGGEPLAPVEQAIEREIGARGGSAEAEVVRAVYEGRGFRPAWSSAERRAGLVAAVEDSRADGLEPADYRIAQLRAHLSAPPDDPAALAAQDVLFTDSLARLVRHLRYGKVPPASLYSIWNFSPPPDASVQALRLQSLIDAEPLQAAIAQQAPQLEAYGRLREALARYRTIEGAGGWPQVAAGPTLRRGDRGARVAALRARLIAGGDLEAAGGEARDRFDDALAAAVARFQERHGLGADGAAGKATLDALNVGVAERIAQIRVNLERLRWVAGDFGPDLLLVDIAGFRAELRLADRTVWATRVVVGRPSRETPSLLDSVQHLVLNPKWVVPPTILREDVIPGMRRNPGYLNSHRLRLVDRSGRAVDPSAVDWSSPGGGFPYQVVQSSGRTARWGRSSSRSPTATRSTCTTPPRARCSSGRPAPTARAVYGWRIRKSWRCCCSAIRSNGTPRR